MKKTHPLVALCLGALLASCATQVPVQIMKPAEINMAGARKLAVLDFDYPREAKTDNIFGLLYLSMTGQAMEKTNTPEQRLARYTTDKLLQALIGTNYFTIVNSKDILSKLSGVSTPSAVEIGQRSDAQAIVVGEITGMNRSLTYPTEIEKAKDKATGVVSNVTVYYVQANDEFSLTYRVVSTATGAILATKSFSGTKEQKVKSAEQGSLATLDAMCKTMVDEWLPQITRQIAPYMVSEYRTLMDDKTKDPLMKDANSLVKSKAYDKALALYVQIWQKTKNPAAGVNAAVMYDVLGQLDKALSAIDEVVNATSDKTAIREKARLERLKAENDKLAEQLK